MKKPLVMIAILVALLLIYWLTQKSGNVVETGRPFVAVDSAGVTSIRVEFTDGSSELVKEGDKWRLVKPLNYPAAEKTVASALGRLKEMNRLTLITEREDKFSEYQVDDSAAVKLTLTQGGKEEKLLLGRNGPSGSTTYARKAGSTEVWEIGGSHASLWKKKPKDWRDKTIVDMDMNAFSKLVLQHPDGTVTLTLQDSIWKLESPKASFDAEKSMVERVTRLLAKLTAVDFADTLSANAFDKATFQLRAESSTGDPMEFQFMPTDTSGNQYFVRKSGAPSAFVVYKSTAQALMKKPEDFRTKAEGGTKLPATKS